MRSIFISDSSAVDHVKHFYHDSWRCTYINPLCNCTDSSLLSYWPYMADTLPTCFISIFAWCTPKPGPVATFHPRNQSSNELLIWIQVGSMACCCFLPVFRSRAQSWRSLVPHTTSFVASDYISDRLKPWKHIENLFKQISGVHLGEVGFHSVLQPPAKRALGHLQCPVNVDVLFFKNKNNPKPSRSTSIGSALKCRPSYLPNLICLILSNESILLHHWSSPSPRCPLKIHIIIQSDRAAEKTGTLVLKSGGGKEGGEGAVVDEY